MSPTPFMFPPLPFCVVCSETSLDPSPRSFIMIFSPISVDFYAKFFISKNLIWFCQVCLLLLNYLLSLCTFDYLLYSVNMLNIFTLYSISNDPNMRGLCRPGLLFLLTLEYSAMSPYSLCFDCEPTSVGTCGMEILWHPDQCSFWAYLLVPVTWEPLWTLDSWGWWEGLVE